jgi:hypothetical protein
MVTYVSERGPTQTDAAWGLRHGVIAGLVAGIVFAAYEMTASAFMMGWDAFFMPLRMIGAMILGQQALDPSYSLLAAGAAGVITHVVLSIVYGAAFGGVMGAAPVRADGTLIAIACAYGLALWLFNFYVVAPAAFPWFLQSTPLVQFIGHTFFFGSVLGYYLWKSHERSGLEGPAA